jgi:predicted nuclease of predicted toxin-antitoxin system
VARGPGGDLRLRLLLDEHLSPEIARRLRARGHDAIAVRDEEGLIGQPDRIQFAWAGDRRRTIVTRDLADFRPLLAEAIRRGAPAYGLVCVPRRFRLTRGAIGELVEALDELLDSHPEDDAIVRRYGGEYWL